MAELPGRGPRAAEAPSFINIRLELMSWPPQTGPLSMRREQRVRVGKAR